MINNLLTVSYMLLMLGIVVFINTLLGAVIASSKNEFSIKKLFKGILKAILIGMCLLLFSFSIELLPVVLNTVNISINENLITVFELIMIVFTAYKKYLFDCYFKFKKILGGE